MSGTSEPHDDGACRHLLHRRLPSIALPSTAGQTVDLSAIGGRVVLYAYPRTSRPDEPALEGWDSIPGARGCTPQSRAFRDHYNDLLCLGVTEVYGLSTQDSAYQQEMVQRLHLPFAVLSDARLQLASALGLPTLTVAEHVLLKRATFVIDDGIIHHVFYPIPSPEQNAGEVLAWLRKEQQCLGGGS